MKRCIFFLICFCAGCGPEDSPNFRFMNDWKMGLYLVENGTITETRSITVQAGDTLKLAWMFSDSTYLAEYLDLEDKPKASSMEMYPKRKIVDYDEVSETRVMHDQFEFTPKVLSIKKMEDRIHYFTIVLPAFPVNLPLLAPGIKRTTFVEADGFWLDDKKQKIKLQSARVLYLNYRL